MGIFDLLFGKEPEKDKNDYLEDWQRKEIKDGNYDSWNFEEEELEDDDYYSEDD